MFKQEKGITLVALVITIIVLLILAGVSISLVAGDNGILTKSKTAATKTKYSQITEAVGLALSDCQGDYVSVFETAEGDASTLDEYFTEKKVVDSLKALGFTMVQEDGSAISSPATTGSVDGTVYRVYSGSDSKNYVSVKFKKGTIGFTAAFAPDLATAFPTESES